MAAIYHETFVLVVKNTKAEVRQHSGFVPIIGPAIFPRRLRAVVEFL